MHKVYIPSSYLRASSAEALDFGHIICREEVRDFFAHLFDVAGDHDGPEQTHRGNKPYQSCSNWYYRYLYILNNNYSIKLILHWKYSKTALPEGARGESTLFARQAAVSTDHLRTVPWLYSVHQVVVQDDVHRAGQLTGRGFLWHLLHCDGLVVLIDGQTELGLQWIVLFILNGSNIESGNIKESIYEPSRPGIIKPWSRRVLQ